MTAGSTGVRAGALVALVLVMGACSDEPAAPSSSSDAGRSQSSTAGEGSVPSAAPESSDGGETVAGAELGQRMLDAMTAASTAAFTVDSQGGAGASTSQGQVRIGADSTSTRATTEAQGQRIEIVLLPGQAYVNLGETGDGKPWLRVSPDSTDPTAASIAQFLDTFAASSDPRSAIAVYGQAGDFAVVGTEDVGGVQATRYSGAIPPEALLASFPEQARAGIAPLLGTEPFPVEIWLDGDDRPVRFVQEATIQGATTTTTQEYSAWGAPVDIAAPPAEQTKG